LIEKKKLTVAFVRLAGILLRKGMIGTEFRTPNGLIMGIGPRFDAPKWRLFFEANAHNR